MGCEYMLQDMVGKTVFYRRWFRERSGEVTDTWVVIRTGPGTRDTVYVKLEDGTILHNSEFYLFSGGSSVDVIVYENPIGKSFFSERHGSIERYKFLGMAIDRGNNIDILTTDSGTIIRPLEKYDPSYSIDRDVFRIPIFRCFKTRLECEQAYYKSRVTQLNMCLDEKMDNVRDCESDMDLLVAELERVEDELRRSSEEEPNP